MRITKSLGVISVYAGKFLKETQPRRNLNYWALWASYKF
jgi:hypothetical protein